MLKAVAVKVEDIYVPAARRKELDPGKVESIAEEMISEVEENPIQVRRDKDRYVLVRGVNRLEASKALGEETIQAYIVSAHQH